MRRLSEVLRFKKELFFEGAVQIDWLYDPQKRDLAAKSFVFHGPEYFGVSRDDVQTGTHELVDTCSFTAMLARRLYEDGEENPIIMAIAGYGSGKSHLGLSLGALFGTDPDKPLNKQILKNIADADREIGDNLRHLVNRPNLVLALNGMKDFNLTYELLSSARRALKEYRVDDSPLRDITRAYEVARTFLQRSFSVHREKFETSAVRSGLNLSSAELVNYLADRVDSDPRVFEIINEVYQEANGVSIRWDDGISAGDVLAKLQETFCGDRGIFNKILIIFDEFGRFIEYASEFPSRAGQSAIQQIFEAIQNSNHQIIFVGFIQSELKSYLARVDKSANIVRYIGRFEVGDKVYLSSNLETIFANLIERKNTTGFEETVVKNQATNKQTWKELHSDLNRWLPTASDRSIWREWDKFSKIILEGTYPLHPLTTWMLANLSNWLQQRSALTFVNSEFELVSSTALTDFGNLPIIYPTRLITSDFFTELLRAEEEGRQQSEYCILYSQVLRKYKDKCTDVLLDVLSANLILRIGRFKTVTREEALRALKYCLPYTETEISKAVNELENELGVISFDSVAGCFDFIEDATGANDFRSFIQRFRNRTVIESALAFLEIKRRLNLESLVDTDFGKKHGIRTLEWQYVQDILPLSELGAGLVAQMKKEWLASTSPDKPKGRLIWVYTNPEDSPTALETLAAAIGEHDLGNSPIVFFLINSHFAP